MRSHAKAPAAGSVWIAGAAALILAFVLLAISSASALAAPGHSVVRTFSTGPNTDPRAIAVDSDGYSYVAEQSGERVEKFDPAGNQVDFSPNVSYIGDGRILGTPLGPFPEWFIDYHEVGIAVDNSDGPNDGYLYVSESRDANSSVHVYDPTGIYKGELDPKAWEMPPGGFSLRIHGIAVNQATGEVYVGVERNQAGPGVSFYVNRYAAPGGDPEASRPTGKLNASTGPIAVDNAGAAYIASFDGLKKFDHSQFDQASPTPSITFSNGSAKGVAVNSSGELFALVDTQIRKWSATGVQQGSDFGQIYPSRENGLQLGPGDEIFATDRQGGIFVFGPDEVQLPTGTTGASSNLTPSSADVEGVVDPDGAGSITACEFRFGEDTGYSSGSVPCTPGGAISSPTSVSASLAGLVSGTTYHYRLFLINANGTQMDTDDQTFTTPAATQGVSTGEATNIQNDSAELNGSFEGDGQDVHYFFEWGRTTAYGHTTPAPPGGDAGDSPGFQNVPSVQISGLKAKTIYHFRLVVSTPGGITRGADQKLTTLEAVGSLTAEPATAVKDSSAELQGSYEGDPDYEVHYYFEWGPTSRYGNFAPAPPGVAIPPTSGMVSVPPVQINGLNRGSIYHFRIVATTAIGTSVSPDLTFKTANSPSLLNLDSRDILADSVELIGEINPNLAHTTYHFEWGPTTAYGNVTPVPDGDAGSGDSAIAVSTRLEGLTPGITYHFRLIAANEYGAVATGDQTFGFYPPACPNAQLRQETRANDLPDCRAYELVTPSFDRGTYIKPAFGTPPAPLATSPSKIAYTGWFGTFSEDAGDPSNVLDDLYVSTRTDTGWFQKFVGKPAREAFMMGGPPGGHVENFAQFTQTRIYTGAQTSRDLGKVISYEWGWPSNNFGQQGKASNAPYVFDTSSGKVLERWPSNLAEVPKGESYVGIPKASADLSHFVFSSNIAFAPGGNEVEREITCCHGPVGTESPGKAFPIAAASIYDNNLKTGEVELASIKADNTSTFEGFVFNVSDDGRRILMSEERASPTSVLAPVEPPVDVKGPFYVRVDGQRTWEIAPGHQITYVGSTDDGATVYITSKEQLTADDHDSGRDLFVWRESDPEALTRVSKGQFGEAGNENNCDVTWSGGGCSVQMIDFSRYAAFGSGQGGNGLSDSSIASKSGDVYFLSPEELIEGKGQTGQANLYLERKGTLRFVLSIDPKPVCSTYTFEGACAAGAIARMQITPDGSHMAFVASANVTGFNSSGHTEMYTYDPESSQIVCASCRRDGQPVTSETWASQNGLFQTYDGRVFFRTDDPLVPRDSNKVGDVYEYTEGRPQLITSGVGGEYNNVFFVGQAAGLVSVSANGTDVYFATTDTLVTQDHNGAQFKVYDARTGGGFPAERTPEKCTAADECHGPGASPPVLPSDRTSANLGKKSNPKAHKAKHKKHNKKKKRKHKSAKKRARAAKGHDKQGGPSHG